MPYTFLAFAVAFVGRLVSGNKVLPSTMILERGFQIASELLFL